MASTFTLSIGILHEGTPGVLQEVGFAEVGDAAAAERVALAPHLELSAPFKRGQLVIARGPTEPLDESESVPPFVVGIVQRDGRKPPVARLSEHHLSFPLRRDDLGRQWDILTKRALHMRGQWWTAAISSGELLRTAALAGVDPQRMRRAMLALLVGSLAEMPPEAIPERAEVLGRLQEALALWMAAGPGAVRALGEMSTEAREYARRADVTGDMRLKRAWMGVSQFAVFGVLALRPIADPVHQLLQQAVVAHAVGMLAAMTLGEAWVIARYKERGAEALERRYATAYPDGVEVTGPLEATTGAGLADAVRVRQEISAAEVMLGMVVLGATLNPAQA